MLNTGFSMEQLWIMKTNVDFIVFPIALYKMGSTYAFKPTTAQSVVTTHIRFKIISAIQWTLMMLLKILKYILIIAKYKPFCIVHNLLNAVQFYLICTKKNAHQKGILCKENFNGKCATLCQSDRNKIIFISWFRGKYELQMVSYRWSHVLCTLQCFKVNCVISL